MSEYYQRTPGFAEQARCRFYQVGVGLHRFRDRGWREQFHVFLQTHDVGRHLQGNRARPAGVHLQEGLVDQARSLSQCFYSFRPFRQALQDAQLIRYFMQESDSFSYPLRRDLTGQAQHPFIARIGRAQGRTGVQDAWPGHDSVNAHPAAGASIAVRHVRDALFMAGIEYPEPVAFVVNGIEQVVGLSARQTEDGLNAVSAY